MRKLNKNVWPFQCVLGEHHGCNADKWCSDFVGRRFLDWYGYNISNGLRVYAFKDEAHLLILKMKWGIK